MSLPIPDPERFAARVYMEQLGSLGYGVPLWYPEPEQARPIRIGDVGKIDLDGCFKRYFNVTVDKDHPYNERGVPDHFKKLVFKSKPKIDVKATPRVLPADSLPSGGVDKIVNEAGLDVDVPGYDIGVGAGYRFRCRKERGAVLVLRESAFQTSVSEESIRFKKYMLKNYRSWIKFIETEWGEECSRKSLIFVRGTVKTTPDWAAGVYLRDDESVDSTFGIKVFHVLKAGVQSTKESRWIATFRHREAAKWDPAAASTKDHLAVVQVPHDAVGETDGDWPEDVAARNAGIALSTPLGVPDQCIFLRCFVLRRRWNLRHDAVCLAGPPEVPESMHVDSAADDILDYILERSPEAGVAIAGDEDISCLLKRAAGATNLQSTADYLHDKCPQVVVSSPGEIVPRPSFFREFELVGCLNPCWTAEVSQDAQSSHAAADADNQAAMPNASVEPPEERCETIQESCTVERSSGGNGE